MKHFLDIHKTDADALRGLLSGYGAEALADMAENGHIVADCQFCGAHYSFAVDDLVTEAP